MKTVAKTLLILLGVIVLIALLSSLLVNLLFDPNQYRTEISKLIEEKTGRGFQIRGDIDFNFFPWLGLKANDLELANAEGFGEEPFATIDRIKVRVRLLPLLKKELELGNISVSGLQLNLAQHADGRNNWQGLLPGPAMIRTRKTSSPNANNAASAAFVATSVGGLNLKSSRISWINQVTGENFLIDGLSLRSGAMRSGTSFDVDWEFNFHNRITGLNAHCKLTTTAALDLEQRLVQMQGAAVTVSLEQPDRFPAPLQLQGKADVLLNLDKNRLELNELSFGTDQVLLNGHLNVENFGKDPHTVGELASSTFNLKKVLSQFGKEVSPRSGPKAFEQASIKCSVDAAADRFQFDSCTGRLDDTHFNGRLEVDRAAQPGARFNLHLDRIDLDRYGAGPVSSETGPPEKSPVNTKPATTSGASSETFGSSAVTRLGHWTERWLGVNEALASAASTESAASPPAGQAAVSSSKVGLFDMAGKIEGEIQADSVKIRDLEVGNVSTRLRTDGETVAFKPFQAKLCGGTLQGSLHLTKGKNPGWRTQFIATGVDLGQLRKALNMKGSFAAIAKEIQATFTARGSSKEDYKNSLNGQIKAHLTHVKGAGFDINKAIINATPALEGKLPKQLSQPKAVGLDQLSAWLVATNGRFQLNELVGKSSTMELNGHGSIDLPEDKLAILILATLLENKNDAPAYSMLIGVPIPVRVTGTLEDPIVTLDLQDVLHNAKEIKQEERRQGIRGFSPRSRRERRGGFPRRNTE